MKITLTFDETAAAHEFAELFSKQSSFANIAKHLIPAVNRLRGALERSSARPIQDGEKNFNGWHIHTYDRERFLRHPLNFEMPQNEVAVLQWLLFNVCNSKGELLKEITKDGVIPSAERKLKNKLLECGASFDPMRGGWVLQNGTVVNVLI